MKALVLRDEAEAAATTARALMQHGNQIYCAGTVEAARAILAVDQIDLLVLDELVDRRLTHALALSAERRHPFINVIMMTDRPGPEADELFVLIPCISALAGKASAPTDIARLAAAAIANPEVTQARVHEQMKQDAIDSVGAVADIMVPATPQAGRVRIHIAKDGGIVRMAPVPEPFKADLPYFAIKGPSSPVSAKSGMDIRNSADARFTIQ